MGAGVSSWNLAREVSSLGQLGVVSGSALDSILVRKLWDGDVGGHARRAMAAFPSQEIVRAALDRYLRVDGSAADVNAASAGAGSAAVGDDDGDTDGDGEAKGTRRYKLAPMLRQKLNPE